MLRAGLGALDRLHSLCVRVRDTFTMRWNDTLHTLDPSAAASDDAFAETGDVLLLNYPAELHPPSALHSCRGTRSSVPRSAARHLTPRSTRLAPAAHLSSTSARSFLSVRADAGRITAALREPRRPGRSPADPPPWRTSADPASWLVRRVCPGDAAEPGGGDGVPRREHSVTEALTAAVPSLVLPRVDGPVPGAARSRRRLRRGPRPQRRLTRADPRRRAPAPGSLAHLGRDWTS